MGLDFKKSRDGLSIARWTLIGRFVILGFALWVGCTSRFSRSNDFGQATQTKLFVGDFAIQHWVTLECEPDSSERNHGIQKGVMKKALMGDWYNGELIDVPQEDGDNGGVGVKRIRRAGFSEIIGRGPAHEAFGLRGELVKALEANQVELAYQGSVPEYPFQHKDVANPFLQLQTSQDAEVILTGRLRINSTAKWLSSGFNVPADHIDSFVLDVVLKNPQGGTIRPKEEMIVSTPFPVAVPQKVGVSPRTFMRKDSASDQGMGTSTLAPGAQLDQFPLDAPELKRVVVGLVLAMLIEQAERM